MSDDLPSTPLPATVSAATSAQASAPVSQAAEAAALRRLAVQDAPARLETPEHPVRIEGRVAARDTERGEITVETPEGEIRIRTRAPLPPDARVIVTLYRERMQLLADIAVRRAQDGMAAQTAGAPPPPPLKAGDTVTALLLEDTPPQDAPRPLPLEKVAQVIEQVKAAGVREFPLPLPVPAEAVSKMLQAQDTHQALRDLPPPVQRKIAAFVSGPEVLRFVQAALPQARWRALGIPAPPPAPAQAQTQAPPQPGLIQKMVSTYLPGLAKKAAAAPPPLSSEMQEHNLQNILRPAARGAARDPAAQDALSALLPLLERMGAGGEPHPFFPARPPPQWAQDTGIAPRNIRTLRIVRVDPPPAREAGRFSPRLSPPAPLPAPPGQQAGVVETVTPGGFPLIRTQEGHFILRTPAAVPEGARILFEPLAPQQAAQAFHPLPAAAPAQAALAPETDTAWPALQEAIATLSATAPAAAHNLKNTIPAPAPRFTPAALFFLAALRMGEVQGWLGDSVLGPLRESGKKNLLDRLAGDFTRTAEQARETLQGGWKMFSMPLLHDDHLSQVRFFVRRQNDGEDNKGGGKPATRFLLNLNLSRMGEMQLDGYIHRGQFDMVLRTEDKLPLTMRQEIMRRYAAGLEQARMQGGISFQTRAQNWVTVDMAGRGGTVA